MMNAVNPRKVRVQAIGPHAEEENSENIPVTASAFSGLKLKVKALNRKARDHPPTTL